IQIAAAAGGGAAGGGGGRDPRDPRHLHVGPAVPGQPRSLRGTAALLREVPGTLGRSPQHPRSHPGQGVLPGQGVADPAREGGQLRGAAAARGLVGGFLPLPAGGGRVFLRLRRAGAEGGERKIPGIRGKLRRERRHRLLR
ncbi:PREDICTED: translation initiation factor IF-2-like, partial [Pseudopodoces humilis]|uniref:translation initiation factor IF-2-like n=1 Tax=Pseudopodoces humilis TaxID=181119 RepID=UPI0006B867BC